MTKFLYHDRHSCVIHSGIYLIKWDRPLHIACCDLHVYSQLADSHSQSPGNSTVNSER